MVELRELPGQPLNLAFHLVQLVEDGEALGKHRATGEVQTPPAAGIQC